LNSYADCACVCRSQLCLLRSYSSLLTRPKPFEALLHLFHQVGQHSRLTSIKEGFVYCQETSPHSTGSCSSDHFECFGIPDALRRQKYLGRAKAKSFEKGLSKDLKTSNCHTTFFTHYGYNRSFQKENNKMHPIRVIAGRFLNKRKGKIVKKVKASQRG